MDNMSYDSKYSGAVAEQMLDDYVAGNLGGEGGAKVYELDYYNLGETVTPEEYSAIKDADRVLISGVLATKYDDAGTICLTATEGSVTLVEPISASRSYVKLYVVEVYEALIVKKYDFDTLLPTKTSQLTNDSRFLTSQSLELQLLIPTKTSQLTNDSGFITAEESPKIYHMDALSGLSGTISQEVYDAILAADVVVYGSVVADVYTAGNGGCQMRLIDMFGSVIIRTDIVIAADLSYTITGNNYRIPTATSQLTNDSNFITAADLPPSGGLPTEVIELSSEITLQEGKMLEIDLNTFLTGSLSLRPPIIEDPTRGLLFGIRFGCDDPVPQLTFIGIANIWANGEPPQLEPNSVIEILGCRTVSGGMYFLTWAIYKA